MNEVKLLKCKCDNKDCVGHWTGHCCFLPTHCFVIDGKVDILFVGQGGGAEEREQELPFVGMAGKRLKNIILTVKKEIGGFGVAFSNTIRDNPENNRVPLQEEVDNCIGYLKKDVTYLVKNHGLKVIMPLGNHSNQVITKSNIGITSDRGNVYKVNFGVDINVVPSLHPSYLMRNGTKFDKLLKQDIVKALNLK